MTNVKLLRVLLLGIFALGAVGLVNSNPLYGQGAKKSKGGKVCGDPTVACKTTAIFEPYDLQFQVPANAAIWESVDFYAVVLKSVKSSDENCETFVPEADRLDAQRLFPKMKVFSSRCTMAGSIFYTNVATSQQFMAVYAGLTRAEANQVLATVKATGKFSGANIRRMRAGFNGT